MAPIKKMVAATRDQSSLGNLLIRDEVLNQAELSELLVEFNDLKVEELLGQFLVRKGIISPEKLEFLLIRQAAERNGGVEKEHLKKAIAIAKGTSAKVEEGVNELMASTQMAMAKVSGVK